MRLLRKSIEKDKFIYISFDFPLKAGILILDLLNFSLHFYQIIDFFLLRTVDKLLYLRFHILFLLFFWFFAFPIRFFSCFLRNFTLFLINFHKIPFSLFSAGSVFSAVSLFSVPFLNNLFFLKNKPFS